MSSYAVILTHNRPDLLREAVASIVEQVAMTIIVDNASHPPVEDEWNRSDVLVKHVPDQPPNLAKMWNAELDCIARQHDELDEWDVVLMCDDVLIPDGWFTLVSETMRKHDGAAGSTHSYSPARSDYVLTTLSNGVDRMCPWAFILRGEIGLRADESLHWWYCDTDLDWQARRSGGTVIAAGPTAINQRIGEFTASKPELNAQAGIDGQTFHRKWGL